MHYYFSHDFCLQVSLHCTLPRAFCMHVVMYIYQNLKQLHMTLFRNLYTRIAHSLSENQPKFFKNRSQIQNAIQYWHNQLIPKAFKEHVCVSYLQFFFLWDYPLKNLFKSLRKKRGSQGGCITCVLLPEIRKKVW